MVQVYLSKTCAVIVSQTKDRADESLAMGHMCGRIGAAGVLPAGHLLHVGLLPRGA
jgi:hypothetical protein